MAFTVYRSSQETPDFTHQSARPSRPPVVEQQARPQRITVDPRQVLDATDIVEIVGEVVELRPQGRQFVGLCPFHNDSHPSFAVDPSKGTYACWSCSAGIKNGSRGGDAITFVQRHLGMDFKDALYYLAQRAGIPTPQDYHPKHPVQQRPAGPVQKRVYIRPDNEPNLSADRAPLYAVMDKAHGIFSQALVDNPDVVRYLVQERKISLDLLGIYRIGFAEDGFNNLKSHFPDYQSNRALIDAGLIRETDKNGRKSKYDFFRNRLMFGVCDERGRIVAFSGRRLSDEKKIGPDGREIRNPKYLNSPETAIFNKSKTLFGWYEGRQAAIDSGYVILVEGQMDVLGLASRHIRNAAACMGTSLSEDHANMVYSAVDKIVFAFDGDRAGKEAAVRSMAAIFPKLSGNRTATFLTVPDGLDPDEYVSQYGPRVFLKLAEDAQSLPQFLESALTSLHDVSTESGRKDLWLRASNLLSLLPDDSPYLNQLTNIAMRLAGKTEKSQQPIPQRRAMRTFVVNEPSERLFKSVVIVPEVAEEMRPILTNQAKSSPESSADAARQWLERFDKAHIDGCIMSNTATWKSATAAEKAQYESIIRAAPSIFDQYLKSIERERATDDWKNGKVDEFEYVEKVRESAFAKPV